MRSDQGYGWEKQGFAGYTGFGWYRQVFTPPADFDLDHLQLYFGAVDEEAWVYINGKPAFEHSSKSTGQPRTALWKVPFMFDACEHIKLGEPNTLAVRVYNQGAMGGVWKPVYLVASENELNVSTFKVVGPGNWGQASLPGYTISSFSVPYGPLGSGGGAAPLCTRVTDLEPGRNYVYLRYYGGAIWAKLGDEQEFTRYDAQNCDARIGASAARYSTAGSYEVYLGYMDDGEVEVIVHDDPDRVLMSYYDGLVIRSEQQERARMPQVKAETRAELHDAEQYADLAYAALAGPLKEDSVFDGKRAQLEEVERQTAEGKRALAAADDPDQLNLARRGMTNLSREMYNPVFNTGHELRKVKIAEKLPVKHKYGIAELRGLLGNADLPTAEQMRRWSQALAMSLDRDGDGLVTFPWPWMSDKLMPTHIAVPDETDQPLTTFAAPGQYEPLSFAVFATEDLPNLKVTVGALRCGDNELHPANFDAYSVVVWWIGELCEHTEEPIKNGVRRAELLLKDASLIKAHIDKPLMDYPEAPYLKDSTTLKPVDLPAGLLRQFWLTIHIPEGQPAGIYTGSVNIVVDGKRRAKVPLSVEVMPFELPEPMLDYGFYYGSRPASTDAQAWKGGSDRTRQQMLAELKLLRRHGIRYPAYYVVPGTLRETMKLAKEAGMPKDRFFWHRWPSSPEFVRESVQIAKEEGFGEIYFYLHDEASDATRQKEVPVCEMVHANGGKTFVADNHGNALTILQEGLDVPNLAAPTFGTGVLDYYHSLGRKCYTYMRPNAEGRPEMFRRNYGLGLWQMGYDGAMPWRYSYTVYWRLPDKFPWFATQGESMFRNPMRGPWRLMGYKSVDGFVDTIKANCYAAGINDVRYLTAFVEAIEEAKAAGCEPEVAEAQQYLEELRDTVPWDFQGIRYELAQRTASLQELVSK